MSPFSDDMIKCTENPKDHQKKMELINEFSKVAGYKINIQKLVPFPYSNNNQKDKRKNNEILPFVVIRMDLEGII